MNRCAVTHYGGERPVDSSQGFTIQCRNEGVGRKIVRSRRGKRYLISKTHPWGPGVRWEAAELSRKDDLPFFSSTNKSVQDVAAQPTLAAVASCWSRHWLSTNHASMPTYYGAVGKYPYGGPGGIEAAYAQC
jgi:hypothetical protein